MAKSSRSQPAFENSQNSPSPSRRHLSAIPARSTREQRAQLSRLSESDPPSFYYRNHNEMDHSGVCLEDRRQQAYMIPPQFSEAPLPRFPPESEYSIDWRRAGMHPTSPFHDAGHLGERNQRNMPQPAFRGSQGSPRFAGWNLHMNPTQPHMSPDMAWRGSSEEMARGSHNSISPTGRHMDVYQIRSRMNHHDDMSRRGSSDTMARGLQNSASPVSRRLPVPHGTSNVNYEARKFSTSSSLETDGGKDFECKCPKEPPRPRNSFMLFRQHHQSSVAKKNHGLSNPLISKKIGVMWKELPADEREKWTQLAEEEKRIHALKYPGYRYKPNRRPKSQGKQTRRCSKCGGRQNTTRSAGSPGSPRSPESTKSSQSSPSSRTPRTSRTPRGQEGYQGPQTPRTPRTLSTPITPFASSSETSFTTPMSSAGHRSWELPWPPLSASSTNARRQTGITPSSLNRIAEQREPRSPPRDYGSVSPDRRRRRTNDAGDYCSIGPGFDSGRRTEREELASHGRPAPSMLPEPGSLPRSQSLSTLPPVSWQQDTDSRQSSLFGDPPRLRPLEPPLPQTPSWPSLVNYSIHKRPEEKS